MIDPTISAIIGTAISTLGGIMIAWIQAQNQKPDKELGILLPKNVILHKPQKQAPKLFIYALLGALVGYGFGWVTNFNSPEMRSNLITSGVALTNTSPVTSVTLTTSSTLTFTPTPTPSRSILTMDMYYKSINNAKSSGELSNAWNFLTIQLQCNSNDKCIFTNFQNFWWQFKVLYQLFDCDSDQVKVELVYTPRIPRLDSTPTAPAYVLYQLIEYNGEMKINEGKHVSKESPDCPLVISGNK